MIRRLPLPETDLSSFDATRSGPVVLRGAAADWPACQRWSPAFFRARFAALEVHVRLGLPARGVPYYQPEAQYRRRMSVAEFLDHLEARERCYVDSDEFVRFEGLEQDHRFAELVGDADKYSSLWLGCGTRSGLHYDIMSNFLVQVFGSKRAIVMAPEHGRAAYSFPDDPTKSRVCPLEPDLVAYPRFAAVTLLEAELGPGDVLFIPRSWWHHLTAEGPSISLNAWHGPPLQLPDHLRALLDAGPYSTATVARDFVWHGVLGRPYVRRLFCPPPLGRIFYEMAVFSARRRLGLEVRLPTPEDVT
jgi:lysine-specific demethylase 8